MQGIDLFPTLARVLGLAAPATPLPGRDLLDPDIGDAVVVSATSHAVAPDGKVGDAVALRDRDWLLVSFPASGTYRLFDLAADPGEQTNRWEGSATGPVLAARLENILAAAPIPPRTIAQAGDLRQRLKALGYAE